MNVKIEQSWKRLLAEEFEKPYFVDLIRFVEAEYSNHTCFPERDAIFAAFDYCLFDKTKVVIIGQDPYHGPNQANGLCFSVKDGVSLPPSLKNIFKELNSDLDIPTPTSGNLERWAKQGVLLLNATLTVRAHEPGSHQKKGWETFTNTIIKKLSSKNEGIIFMLWGGFAKKKAKFIDDSRHHILTAGHPSPLSANRGYWFDNQHFSKANKVLKGAQKLAIDW